MPGISITFEGVAKSVALFQELIVPWRRQHAQEMAKIEETEKRARIKLLEADLAEKEARTAKSGDERKALDAKALQEKAKANKMQLENDLLRVKVQRAQMELIVDIVKAISPKLDDLSRLNYVVELLPRVDSLLATSITLMRPSSEKSESEA